MPNFNSNKPYRDDYDADQAAHKQAISDLAAQVKRLKGLIESNTSATMPTQTQGRTAYVPPPTASAPAPASTTIIRTTETTGAGTPGATGPAGPSDRMSDAAILITTTPYPINPSDAKPQTYVVNVGASGSACVVNINAGTYSAGKKILIINGQRGGHFNRVSVTCDQGTGTALTDPLNYGGDSLDAVIVSIPTGNSLIASGSATANSGTTSTTDGTTTGTPVPVQLRVQVMGIYHAEAATTTDGITPTFDSGEMMARAHGTTATIGTGTG